MMIVLGEFLVNSFIYSTAPLASATNNLMRIGMEDNMNKRFNGRFSIEGTLGKIDYKLKPTN